jgi:hypothetical protein
MLLLLSVSMSMNFLKSLRTQFASAEASITENEALFRALNWHGQKISENHTTPAAAAANDAQNAPEMSGNIADFIG